MTSRAVLDHLLLQLVILLWGFTAVLGQLIALDPAPLVVWRTGLSALFLAVWAWARRPLTSVSPADLLAATATGGLLALHWVLFFLAGRLGNASTLLAGLSTATLWVALLEPLLVPGKKLSPRQCILALIVTLGVCQISLSDGVVLASLLTAVLCAGVAALFMIINARLIQRVHAVPLTCIELSAASLLTTLAIIALPRLPQAHTIPHGHSWTWLIILSLLCTTVAFTLCASLQQRLPTFTIGLMANLEPLYGIALATLLFPETEKMTPGFYAGTALIIACLVWHALAPYSSAPRLTKSPPLPSPQA